MKKGFTLIEMMAALIILGVITVIAIPLVEKAISNVREDAYNTQVNNILTGARQWGASNPGLLPDVGVTNFYLLLSDLKLAGFIDKNIKNPKTKELFEDDKKIYITNIDGDFVYTFDTPGQPINPYSPIITLNGDALIYVNLNELFTDPGVLATTGTGTTIDSTLVTSVIQKEGTVVNRIDSSGLYKYTITYSATDNGLTTRVIRTVIINDNVAPTLVVPGDVTLLTTVTSYDIMNGVNAYDNSSKPVIITTSSNLVFGQVGNYIITYKATDASGNTTIKTRTIKIEY
jgi:prepilin-type N-terminal cleavage/methylation domain-containing protein